MAETLQKHVPNDIEAMQCLIQVAVVFFIASKGTKSEKTKELEK
jgi:hypothetical protein